MMRDDDFPVPVVSPNREGIFGMVGAAIRTTIARLLFDVFGAPVLMLVVCLYRALLLLAVFEAGSFLVGGFFYDGPWRGWSPVASFQNGVDANVVVVGSGVIAVRDITACLVVGTHCGPSGPDPKPIFAKSPPTPSPAPALHSEEPHGRKRKNIVGRGTAGRRETFEPGAPQR